MVRCAISGATGLVGGALRRRLEGLGYTVVALGRRVPDESQAVRFELGRPLAPERFRDVEVLVHCAYDWTARGWAAIEKTNVRGSISLFQAAAAAGVRTLLFISTVSAYEGCRSLYGRGKMIVEGSVSELGGIVVRSGLVWGPSGRGMFGALMRAARLPVLPVFDGGQQPMFLVHEDDLATVIERIIAAGSPRTGSPVVVAHPEPVPFRRLLERLGRTQGRQPRLVSVPGRWALTGLRGLEVLRLPLRFTSDSLLGLLYPNPRMEVTQPDRWGARLRSLGEEFDKRRT